MVSFVHFYSVLDRLTRFFVGFSALCARSDMGGERLELSAGFVDVG